jgi:serine/threonine-protein kinase
VVERRRLYDRRVEGSSGVAMDRTPGRGRGAASRVAAATLVGMVAFAGPGGVRANVGCAMSCPDNSPDSSCMRSCGAWNAEGAGGGSAGAARQHYGAIAVSPSTLDHGFSFRFPTRRQAEEAALAFCHTQASKPRDCRVEVWFRDTCGSLAIRSESAPGKRDGAWGSAWDARRAAARDKAMASCTKAGGSACRTAVTVCAAQ